MRRHEDGDHDKTYFVTHDNPAVMKKKIAIRQVRSDIEAASTAVKLCAVQIAV